MKNILSLILLGGLISTFSACQNEEEILATSTTSQIDEIENQYVQGDEKIETLLLPGEVKDEEPKEVIIPEYPINQRNIITRAGFESYVGVFKQKGKSCGQYSELKIHLDAEDTKTNSWQEGWTGQSGVVEKGNVNLYFCLVPQDNFKRIRGSFYAVLKLGPGITNTLVRLIDNDDQHTGNGYELNGEPISPSDLQTVLGPGISENEGGNTSLTFHLYEPDNINGATSLPDLGIEYGVLGKISTIPVYETGSILMDEEDSRRSNGLWYEGTRINDLSTMPGLNNLFLDFPRNFGIYLTRVK